MQKEYSMLLRSLTVVNENEECAQCVTKNGTDIFLVKSGIGKVNAAMSANNLIEQYGVSRQSVRQVKELLLTQALTEFIPSL